MSIAWNVVNRTGGAARPVAQRVRRKIAKLEGLLTHFPDDALHLTVLLERRAHGKGYRVVLNLAVPSDVLHVEHASESLVGALDASVERLARRLERLKARYRGDHARHRQRIAPRRREPAAFQEVPVEAGDLAYDGLDLLRRALEQHYGRLLEFVRRQVQHYEQDGVLPRRALDVRDLVNRTAEAALRHPGLRPEHATLDAWLLGLAFHETRRAARRFLRDRRRSLPLELETRTARASGAAPAEEDHPLAELLWERISLPEETASDVLPDVSMPTPGERLEARNLLDTVREQIRRWPREQRMLFEMHFLDGFDPADVAMVVGRDASVVETALGRLQARLWSELSARAARDVARPGASAARRAFSRHLVRVGDEVRGTRLPAE